MFSSTMPPWLRWESSGSGACAVHGCLLDALDGLPHLFGRHVVEEDGFRAVLEGFFKLVGIAHFDLDALALAGGRRGRG